MLTNDTRLAAKPKTFGRGGVHPPQLKGCIAGSIQRVELPAKVVIPLKQHIGSEAVPLVAKGDRVSRGQKIAEAAGMISAPVHASISGTVTAIGNCINLQGRKVAAITIEASAEDHAADMASLRSPLPVRDFSQLSPGEIVAIVANKGVVGLGGATFPTAVKLAPQKPAKLLLIDACECEPVLSCDDALMRACPAQIVQGILAMMHCLGVKRAVIGIEQNKPEAMAALAEHCAGTPIEVQPLKVRYPQGAEKQLIYAVTGREVPSGRLPIDVGCVVNNVGTAYAVYCAVALAQPLIERVVTVQDAGNYLVPIGMSVEALLDEAAKDAAPGALLFNRDGRDADVVAGGPMMGRSCVTLDAPVEKGLSGITCFEPLVGQADPCVRCAKCVDVCPMGLEPYLLEHCGRHGATDEAAACGVMDCIECGSCTYACPSHRPLLDFIRLSKMRIRANGKK